MCETVRFVVHEEPENFQIKFGFPTFSGRRRHRILLRRTPPELLMLTSRRDVVAVCRWVYRVKLAPVAAATVAKV